MNPPYLYIVPAYIDNYIDCRLTPSIYYLYAVSLALLNRHKFTRSGDTAYGYTE